MSKSTNKALIYARAAKYDGVAAQRQADELKKAAIIDGYTDFTVIETTTPSGKPQYDSLIKEIETGEYGAVYVYEISRISREANKLRNFFIKVNEANVEMKVTTLPWLSGQSPATKSFALDLLAEFTEANYLGTSRRIKQGIAAKRGAYRGKEVGA